MNQKQLDMIVDGFSVYDEETEYAAMCCDQILPEGTIIKGQTSIQVAPVAAQRLIEKRKEYYTDRAVSCQIQEKFKEKGWLQPYDAKKLQKEFDKLMIFSKVVAFLSVTFATAIVVLLASR
ncbi:MAG: hypothetical protein RR996_05100, partial [Alistipes sp.]